MIIPIAAILRNAPRPPEPIVAPHTSRLHALPYQLNSVAIGILDKGNDFASVTLEGTRRANNLHALHRKLASCGVDIRHAYGYVAVCCPAPNT